MAGRSSRWITVRTAFDYHWPGRAAVTAFRDPGDYMVKDEVADFAVAKGYATEGKADGSSRSGKGRRKREKPAAKTADDRPVDAVAGEDMAVHDRPADRGGVDQDAG